MEVSPKDLSLSEFLHWVAFNHPDLLEVWRESPPGERAKNLLAQADGLLREENLSLSEPLRSVLVLPKNRGQLCKALQEEWNDFEGDDCDDVELHGNPHFGPCWILVG
jgi:hypothetical protein